jgi:hypothetical protein
VTAGVAALLGLATGLAVMEWRASNEREEASRSQDEDPSLSPTALQLKDRLVDMNARLYGALRLVQDEMRAAFARGESSGSEFDATLASAIDYCRSFDLPALRGDPAFQPAMHAELIDAYDLSCFQLDAPLLYNPRRNLDWNQDIVEILERLEKAFLDAGSPLPQPPFARLPAYRNPNAPATTDELSAYLEGEVAVRLRYGLRIISGTFTLADCGTPCEIDFHAGRQAEGLADFCLKAVDAESFRRAPNYDPEVHEPLLTVVDRVCRELTSNPARAAGLLQELEAALPAEQR